MSSTETTVTQPFATGDSDRCSNCGAPLAADQRYCLECGERRLDARSRFLDTARPGGPAAVAPGPRDAVLAPPPPGRNVNAIIAGVGVLLLAMGVGVLIGEAGGGSTKTVAAPAPQVVTVAGAGAAATPAAFNDDWPAGTDGWTVQLQTLPTASTQPPAVAAAKSAAAAKGATAVGALKSDDYPSLSAGNYVVYSGVYSSRGAAEKAAAKLHGSFAAAKVIHVSSSGSSSGAAASSSSSGGSSTSKPSSSVTNLRSGSTKSYVQKSKALPKQLSTGGPPPAKDNQAPGGGSGGGVSIG